MPKEKPFHHGDLKRVLFEVALKLLDRDGVEGVTIRAVAREAGVSHGAPVNHYRDRRALLTALAQRQFETIRSSVEDGLTAATVGSNAWIEVFGNTLLDFGFEYPHRYKLLWRGDLIDLNDPDLSRIMDQIYAQLCDQIERSMPQVEFDRDTVAVAFWSMIHGYLDMRLSGMFVPLDDKVTGKPRETALLDLFKMLAPRNGS
ncbi:TetR/AcrR family transcriptional regulator [Pontixanthobacter gangjinensis]|uniref:TetR family transcriptional regulator n=1 Tax=Pontixanthobacter gangjinensis TaxID=1028742 RepID=A0A6I4SNZ4_9SPHN|nr:TetR/AcrR family transcriptional regulator [Pontixanthobacter gangjinensis]MXO57671.1 TetR family transcriptional regulator [Pontixanthobacter gangjinensis]